MMINLNQIYVTSNYDLFIGTSTLSSNDNDDCLNYCSFHFSPEQSFVNLPHSSSEQQQLRSDVPSSKVVRTWRGRPWSVEYEVLKVKLVLLPINGQIKTLLCYRQISYPAGGESYSLKSNHYYFT